MFMTGGLKNKKNVTGINKNIKKKPCYTNAYTNHS